jgi:predicted RNA-binding Zn-ribbon protein involved in translation (DUF1610 family)
MKSGKCPKCGQTKIITAQPGEYGHDFQECRMTVTADPRWVLSGRNPLHGHGKLVLYVCQECGFAEWWVRDPKNIPIGKEYKTRLHDASAD